MTLWAQYIASTGGWNDQSGNGRNATLPGSTHNPTIITGDANGHDVFGFAAASQQYVTLPGMAAFTQGEALIVVKVNAQPPSAGSKTGLWNMSQQTSGNATNFPWTDHKVWDTFGLHSGFTPGKNADAIPMATRYVIYGARITAAGVFDSEFNGVAFNHGIGFTVGFPVAPVIGGTSWGPYYLDGRVAEVRLYDAVQSTTDRATAVAALAALYLAPSHARLSGLSGSVSARDVGTPVPHARLSGLSGSLVALDIGNPPQAGARLSGLSLSLAAVDVANPPTGKPYSYAFIIQ